MRDCFTDCRDTTWHQLHTKYYALRRQARNEHETRGKRPGARPQANASHQVRPAEISMRRDVRVERKNGGALSSYDVHPVPSHLVRRSHTLTLPSSAPVTRKDAEASKRTAQQVTGAR